MTCPRLQGRRSCLRRLIASSRAFYTAYSRCRRKSNVILRHMDGSHISMGYRQESCTGPGRPGISNHNLTGFRETCLPTPDGESVTPDEPSGCKIPVSASLARLHPAYIARQPSPSRETTWLTRPFEPSGDGCNYQLPSQLGEAIAAARTLPTISPAFGQPWGNHQSQCGYTNTMLASRYCWRANDHSA